MTIQIIKLKRLIVSFLKCQKNNYQPTCPFHDRIISPPEFQSKHIESSPTLTIFCFKIRQSHTLALCPYRVNNGSVDTLKDETTLITVVTIRTRVDSQE